MKDSAITRRRFLETSALAVAGITLTAQSGFGAPAILKNLGKPNSLFNGVQIGVISYIWGIM